MRLATLLSVLALLFACSKGADIGGVTANTALSADTHSAFPIGHDAKHTGTDCNSCHGSFDSFRQFSCTNGCHAQDVTTAGHPGVPDYKYESAACLACHPGGTADGSFASHPFPISATAVHTGITCDHCHISPGNYAVFSCTTGCHAESETTPAHPGLADYVYASPNCLACHPSGIADGTANHQGFPITATSTHPFGCSQCHKNTTQRADVTTLTCETCHGQHNVVAQHAKVAGFVNTGAKCIACHADDQVDKVAAHTQFPIAFGKATHDTVCLDCHNQRRTDKTYAADFKKSDCLTCHATHPDTTQAALQTGHQSVAGYSYTSDACLSCHPSGIGGAPADHEAHFPIATGSKHEGLACAECHTDLSQPLVAANFKCATCHVALDSALVSKHTANTDSNIHVKASEISTTDSRTCLRCHADLNTNPPANNSLVYLASAHPKSPAPCNNGGMPPHQSAGCTDCHSGYRTDKTYAADWTNLAGSNPLAPPGCAQCHQRRNGNNNTCN